MPKLLTDLYRLDPDITQSTVFIKTVFISSAVINTRALLMSEYKRVILVTGSNTGIGYELVRILAEKGHIVYLSARDIGKGKEAQCVSFASRSTTHIHPQTKTQRRAQS